MKKILVVCVAVLLPCFLVSAQEADDAGTGVGLSVIPRIDLTPEFAEGNGSFTLGNSSLYSLFEGNITENLSFSVCNHWAGFYSVESGHLFDDTKDLYGNTMTRYANWLDWANLTYSFGDFSLTVGKDVITTGGYEYDAYDYDLHPILATSFWNTFDAYQWGAKLGYSLEEDNEITFQVSTSPYAEGVFEKPWFNYSLGWGGSVAGIGTIWSVTALQTGDASFHYLISLGQQVELDNWLLTLDLSNSTMGYDVLDYGLMVHPSVSYSFSETLEVFAHAAYESFRNDILGDGSAFWGGAGVNWYPAENLRVHAIAGYNGLWECSSVGVGATYFFSIGK